MNRSELFWYGSPFLICNSYWELTENLNIPAVVFSIFISRCFPVRVEASSCPQRRIGCWERVWILQESCSTEPCCRARECSPASGAASPACSVSSPHQPTTQWVTLTDSAEKKVTRIYKSRTLPLVFSCSCAPWWDATFVSLTLSFCFLFSCCSSTACCGWAEPAASTRWPAPVWVNGSWTTATSTRSSAGTPRELWPRASPTPSGSVQTHKGSYILYNSISVLVQDIVKCLSLNQILSLILDIL